MRKQRSDWQQHRHPYVDPTDARAVGDLISRIVHGEARISDSAGRNGHYGILIMAAHLIHNIDSVGHACRYLRMPADDLITSFNNLVANGLIGENTWPKRNKQRLLALRDESEDRDSLIDWCQMAAVASGYMGVQA